MNILYVTNKPIFPLIDGGCVAMYQFLKSLLQAGYNVKNISISTYKHPFKLSEYPENLSSIIYPESVFIDTRIKPLEALNYFFKKGSYNVERFNSKQLTNSIQKYLQENEVQLVILESIFLGNYIDVVRNNSKAKIILRSHNVEFQIWEKLALNQTSWLKKKYIQKLAKDLKRYELNTITKFDGIACISRIDKEVFKSILPNNNYVTLPVSLSDIDKISDYSNPNFFHIGSMNWKPNLEAVEILITTIFPKIREKLPNAKLIIAGSNMPKQFISNENEGIEVVGFVKSISDFMTENGIMISPIKSGSGVRIKLLEAMNLGVPILTTTQGAEGIDTFLDNEYLKSTCWIEDESELFIQKAIELALNQEIREEIGRNAKKLIETKYQTEQVTKKLIEFIKHIS